MHEQVAGHVTEFAKILTGLHGDRLDDWIIGVGADDQPDLGPDRTARLRELQGAATGESGDELISRA